MRKLLILATLATAFTASFTAASLQRTRDVQSPNSYPFVIDPVWRNTDFGIQSPVSKGFVRDDNGQDCYYLQAVDQANAGLFTSLDGQTGDAIFTVSDGTQNGEYINRGGMGQSYENVLYIDATTNAVQARSKADGSLSWTAPKFSDNTNGYPVPAFIPPMYVVAGVQDVNVYDSNSGTKDVEFVGTGLAASSTIPLKEEGQFLWNWMDSIVRYNMNMTEQILLPLWSADIESTLDQTALDSDMTLTPDASKLVLQAGGAPTFSTSLQVGVVDMATGNKTSMPLVNVSFDKNVFAASNSMFFVEGSDEYGTVAGYDINTGKRIWHFSSNVYTQAYCGAAAEDLADEPSTALIVCAMPSSQSSWVLVAFAMNTGELVSETSIDITGTNVTQQSPFATVLVHRIGSTLRTVVAVPATPIGLVAAYNITLAAPPTLPPNPPASGIVVNEYSSPACSGSHTAKTYSQGCTANADANSSELRFCATTSSGESVMRLTIFEGSVSCDSSKQTQQMTFTVGQCYVSPFGTTAMEVQQCA